MQKKDLLINRLVHDFQLLCRLTDDVDIVIVSDCLSDCLVLDISSSACGRVGVDGESCFDQFPCLIRDP